MQIHLWGWIYFPLYFIQVRMQTLLNAYANKEATVLDYIDFLCYNNQRDMVSGKVLQIL